MLRVVPTFICSALLCGSVLSQEPPTDGNRLAYLDECNPWYPHTDFPKLITPQWVGEEGVEAVIVLGIDDMRDPAKYEKYLRPILNRLKQIDGRAPVSIMSCEVKPDDPQLQSWLGEGLSIEVHTIDHPCPLLQGGDFAKAKSTYDRCVDLMGKIPGNKPVAFRTPCCDSLNTVSPRFFAEIFDSTTENGNFLQIDSSVFTFFTSEDESLPRELVLDANGKERFLKYMPRGNKVGNIVHDNFVNYIKNYPYPYVINNSCWEIPCLAPSDWSAQHLHGVDNPITIEDWKAAIDLTVHKQGCFSLVFHPHNWIKPEQVVEMIDHAVAKHGNKVKFLNFREVAERLNTNLGSGRAWRDWSSNDLQKLMNLPKTIAFHGEPMLFYSSYLEDLQKTLIVVATPQEMKLGLKDGRLEDPATPESPPEAVQFPNSSMVPRCIRSDGSNNGFFIHDRHLCWQNEDTAHLPDLIYRVSFDEILAEHRRAEARKALPPVPVGAAVVDITPEYPVRLTGYGNRLKESEGIAARIHARALVIGGDLGPAAAGSAAIQSSLSPVERLTTSTTEPTRERVRGATENAAANSNAETQEAASSPLIRPSATFSPDLGGEGTIDQQPLAVLLTVDNCGVPAEMTEAVFARLAGKHGLTRERFVISSTHSHSAPWLRGFAPNIFAEIPDDHAAHLAQYEKELIEKLVDVVDKAIDARRPGNLSSGFGETNFAMNRRALTDGKWSGFGEVPDGPTDKRVPVLAAHDTDGKLIAVLANYACHCTTETGDFNQISGDWAGFAADMLEADHPGAVALIAIGCGADANPSPRGTHDQAKQHGRTMADEVTRVLATGGRNVTNLSPLPISGGEGEGQGEGVVASDPAATSASNPLIRPSATFSPDLGGEGTMRRIDPRITCGIARINLPLGPLPSRTDWEQQATQPGVTGSRARYFLEMLEEGKEIPTTVPDYPVQTWCFGEDLAMVFLGGEVVVDYSIRMNGMFDSDRLWINAYSNDVPCYIASARVLREGGYEADSSMLYYRQPTRLAPEAEDVLCDAVQKLLPHEFYSEELQRNFPAPKSPEDSLNCMTTKPDLRVVLAASEPLIRDPVAFDWDERGRLWVVEMGDYPEGNLRLSPLPISGGEGQGEGVATNGENARNESSPLIRPSATSSPDRGGEGTGTGRIQILEDTDKNGVYDKATTFLDGLAFPSGIHCWRGGAIITMAPEIFYAEDTDNDLKADLRETLYQGFAEGNQQHRVNGLRWGLDGWLYLANGDSGGEIVATGYIPESNSSPLPISGGEGQGEGVVASDPAASSASNPLIRPSATFSPKVGGEGTLKRDSVSLRGRDLRIHPDTNGIDPVSGQTQFGRERDDFGNWFGNNNSNPIFQFVLEDRYVRRNPHAAISQVTAQVSAVPGAVPVYPTSRTLARFNDFAYANRFTSACSTMIYRDTLLGEQYYGNAFTSEPVHNLVSRLVLTRDGFNFKGERAADEQQSEFLASTDNWFRPTMIRTGPDGAIWVADMYRAVIEHPEWIPPEYQRKMNLYAGNDRGRIYRIVPASECCGDKAEIEKRKADEPASASGGRQPSGTASSPLPISGGEGQGEGVAADDDQATGVSSPLIRPSATFSPDLGGEGTESQAVASRADGAREYFEQPWNEIPIEALYKRLDSPNGWWRDTAHRILLHRATEVLEMLGEVELAPLEILKVGGPTVQGSIQRMALMCSLCEAGGVPESAPIIRQIVHAERHHPDPLIRRFAIQSIELDISPDTRKDSLMPRFQPLIIDPDAAVRLQAGLSLGKVNGDHASGLLGELLRRDFNDSIIRSAILTSLTPENISGVLAEVVKRPENELNEELIGILLAQAAAMGRGEALGEPLTRLVLSVTVDSPASRFELLTGTLNNVLNSDAAASLKSNDAFQDAMSAAYAIAAQIASSNDMDADRRAAAVRFAGITGGYASDSALDLSELLTAQTPIPVQIAAVNMMGRNAAQDSVNDLLAHWNSFAPVVRAEVLTTLLQRESTGLHLLDAVRAGSLAAADFDALQRDALLNHRNDKIAGIARTLFGEESPSARASVVEDFRSQISNLKSDAVAGRAVFEKRCGICHRLQDVGKEIGADLAALKDRSTEALLTAVLDPNRAVESKFLAYTVVTKDGLQHSGMLKGETGGSLTLIGNDGKELTVARADIEELVSSKRSLMPEGLEKDISAQELANVFAFVQSAGTPWKRFDGNVPQYVTASEDGTVTLPASAAEIYGPSLVFEQKYGNLGFWTSTEDYAKWSFEVPKSGFWTIEFDFACDNSTAGSLIRFSTGTRMLTARVPGSGSWDQYQTWQAGTIDLHKGRGQLIITAPETPPFALIDLRAVRLIPPQ